MNDGKAKRLEGGLDKLDSVAIAQCPPKFESQRLFLPHRSYVITENLKT